MGEKVLFTMKEDRFADHLMAQYHQVLSELGLPIYIWNMKTLAFQTNAAWNRFGLAPLPNQLRLEDMRMFVFMEDYDKEAIGVFNFFKSKQSSYTVRYRYWTVTSDIVWVENHIYTIRDFDGEILYLIGYLDLIDDQKRIELGLPSYGLLSRHALSTCADIEIQHCKPGSGLAMIWVDICKFREINEKYSYGFGDKVLDAIGKKLAMLCDEDMYVSRGEGAGFIMLVRSCPGDKRLKEIAELIQEVFAQDLYVGSEVVRLKADVGIAVTFASQENSIELRRDVNVAVYRAKNSRENVKYVLFDEMMMAGEKRYQAILELMQSPNYANYLEMYLQPQYKAKSKKLFGFEALLRVYHPVLGQISPGEFIPIAEEHGKIVDIGYWIIEKCCEIVRQLLDARVSFNRLAINVSANQLAMPDFAERTKEIIGKSGIPPEKIELEITESVLISSMKQGSDMLKSLRDFGFSIAQDDFGSGYSSFNYMKDLKLDTVKIDKAFVDDMCDNPKSYHIIEMILQLAKKTSSTVVAEGVETESQMSILKAIDCPVIQGFYFDKPMPVPEILHRFKKKEKQ